MMGEWRAKVDGKEMSGKEALQKAGLKPLVPEGKDALAILSTNAAAVAETMDAARHARTIIDATPRVFALSLEALTAILLRFFLKSPKSILSPDWKKPLRFATI